MFPLFLNAVLALDLFSYLEEAGFVIKLIVFAYVIFWLYTTFAEVPVLFGISVLVASFFLILYPLPAVALVVILFVILVFGNMLQQMLFFGLFPALSILGIKTPQMGAGAAEAEMQELQEIEQKLMRGNALSQAEQEMYRKNMEAQMRAEQTKQQMSQQVARQMQYRR